MSHAAQYWFRDSSNYIRSSIDINKCVIGAAGSSTLGTKLIINDCYVNDDRFKWDTYSDDSIRPRNNKFACIKPQLTQGEELGLYLILGECNDNYKAFSWKLEGNSRRRNLQTEAQVSLDKEKEMVSVISTKSLVTSERKTTEVVGTMDLTPVDGCEDSPIGWYDIFGPTFSLSSP